MAENKGGRPRRELTDDERAQVEALAQYVSQETIADYLGMTRKTFKAILDRDDDLSTRYKRARAATEVKITKSLIMDALAGSKADRMFWLKCQAGWRETTNVEHSNPDGSMKQVVVFEIPHNGRDAIEAALSEEDEADGAS